MTSYQKYCRQIRSFSAEEFLVIFAEEIVVTIIKNNNSALINYLGNSYKINVNEFHFSDRLPLFVNAHGENNNLQLEIFVSKESDDYCEKIPELLQNFSLEQKMFLHKIHRFVSCFEFDSVIANKIKTFKIYPRSTFKFKNFQGKLSCFVSKNSKKIYFSDIPVQVIDIKESIDKEGLSQIDILTPKFWINFKKGRGYDHYSYCGLYPVSGFASKNFAFNVYKTLFQEQFKSSFQIPLEYKEALKETNIKIYTQGSQSLMRV